MDILRGTSDLKSKVVWDGVILKKDGIQQKVKLEGDRVEETPTASFVEGALKGVGILLTGGSYPLVAGVLKGVDGYLRTTEAAEKLGERDDWVKAKAGLKGAFLSGTKGAIHGLLDSMVVGSLGAVAVATMGPVGFLLTPVIGGVYNFVKDSLRI